MRTLTESDEARAMMMARAAIQRIDDMYSVYCHEDITVRTEATIEKEITNRLPAPATFQRLTVIDGSPAVRKYHCKLVEIARRLVGSDISEGEYAIKKAAIMADAEREFGFAS